MLNLQSRLGDWEVISPGRELVKEGELIKISRKREDLRYFILLTDCLLYATYTGNLSLSSASLRVSYTIPLNHLQIQLPLDENSQNEFSITSSVRSCTLRRRNIHERNDWLEALNGAVEDYRSKKATFLPSDQSSAVTVPADRLGDCAPVWVPDHHVTMCQACSCSFSLVIRRHHCRACGRVVCYQCATHKAALRYRQFQPARVCDDCYNKIEKSKICSIF